MGQSLCILNFHGLGLPPSEVPSDERPFWVEVPLFEAVLDLVRDRSDVQVTFDDSNASDYEVAFPALQSRNMRAKFFVLAQRMDRKGSLSKRQVRSMLAAGMTIGNHGLRHCAWTKLNDGELHSELIDARDMLEDVLGVEVNEAACPFGMYNRRVLKALQGSGYTRIYTTDEIAASPGSVIQPRYSIVGSHSLAQIQRMISPTPRTVRNTCRRMRIRIRELC
jgi:peptidoglycan/xylan/chitin deacetylase (PgdA/CDA1 family)